MPLNLYRRHRQDCSAGHPEESRSGEFEERSKKWKRCGCQIYAAGSLGRHFRRRNTKRIDWEEARVVASAWENAGRWEADMPTAPAPVKPTGVTFEEAVKEYLADHHKHSATNTAKKYTFIMARLQKYASNKGIVMLNQWTPVEVRECRDLWRVSQRTTNRDMSVVRAFFERCVDNEWLDRNPAKRVKNPRGKAGADGRHEQKLPFTDDELTRMYDTAEKRYGKMEIKWSRESHSQPAEAGMKANYRYSWTGKDLSDFISVSVYTGLRISDVSTFHIDRLKPTGEVHVRTTKGGSFVYTWIPEWLQAVIRRRRLEVGPFIFGKHETTDMNVVTDIWRRKLKRLWRLCGTWKDKPTPHRFRHTFARILLERPGVSVRDVAELLGNTETVVRKHYSAWVPERQERLTNVLRAAFKETPRPENVVEMPKTGSK